MVTQGDVAVREGEREMATRRARGAWSRFRPDAHRTALKWAGGVVVEHGRRTMWWGHIGTATDQIVSGLDPPVPTLRRVDGVVLSLMATLVIAVGVLDPVLGPSS